MGRTIPSFRIAILLEEKRWKLYRQYLHKKEQKIFKHMFSIAYLFNSASSYAANPIRINPILFSIALYHQKKISSFIKNSNVHFFFIFFFLLLHIMIIYLNINILYILLFFYIFIF